MGKYIIELKQGETAYKTVDSNGTPLIQLLAPMPYTEPDLEQVRKEAYEEGWKDAEDHYEKGYNDGYDTGLSDAWEAARNIVALSTVDRREVFGSEYMYSILEKHTASEAIEKIRQYEQEEIHLGDEVTFLPNNAKGIVTECHVPDVYSDNDKYAVWCGGTMEYVLKQHLTKTGRHFPEIAAVLEKMREDAT